MTVTVQVAERPLSAAAVTTASPGAEPMTSPLSTFATLGSEERQMTVWLASGGRTAAFSCTDLPLCRASVYLPLSPATGCRSLLPLSLRVTPVASAAPLTEPSFV